MHLENINMELGKGKRIALIGESGSGKSTLLKLIRGLYPLKDGFLYLNDLRLPRGFGSISDSVTLIPQEPEIFTTTIRRNITLGVSHHDKHIMKFVRMARFNPVLKRLPRGLDTNVMEKGVSLSGGEKQRLALARGLLAIEDSEFILLDEATSSVDSKNTREIYKNIFRAYKGRTILVAIHNLSLLPEFDYIYHFKKGKIIEQGTFKEIMKSKGFKKLWDKFHKKKKT
jgi:ABC-type bacteriocin/lantibiotic exporter with double-glycine peptidase domain